MIKPSNPLQWGALLLAGLSTPAVSAQVSQVQDFQIANLLTPEAQIKINIDRGLRAYPPIRQAFERLGATKGCAVWNAALNTNGIRMEQFSGLMVAAARQTIPDEVLAAAQRAGVSGSDALLDPYRSQLQDAVLAAGANEVVNAIANDVVEQMTAAAQRIDEKKLNASDRSAEIDALMATPGNICTSAQNSRENRLK